MKEVVIGKEKTYNRDERKSLCFCVRDMRRGFEITDKRQNQSPAAQGMQEPCGIQSRQDTGPIVPDVCGTGTDRGRIRDSRVRSIGIAEIGSGRGNTP